MQRFIEGAVPPESAINGFATEDSDLDITKYRKDVQPGSEDSNCILEGEERSGLL